MSIITRAPLHRRTVLRGLGATIGLPLLDAMVPAIAPFSRTAAAASLERTRLVCIELVHGSAGSSPWGASQNLWSPVETGSTFDLGPTALSPLEPFRKHVTIVSDTDVEGAEGEPAVRGAAQGKTVDTSAGNERAIVASEG